MSITIRPLSADPLPPTYLLTVDGARILLDCGAYDKSSEATLPGIEAKGSEGAEPTHDQVAEYLSTLRSLAPTLNLVLLSHPLLTSLGLLPYLRARCGLRCPVYATLPTREMGRYAVEEWAEARSAAERNDARYEQLRQSQSAAAAKIEAAAAAASKKRKGKATKIEAADVEMAIADGEPATAANAEHKGPDDETNGPDETDAQSDPWDPAWKLTIQEIRDAFLAINAVRWTQPIHLTGECPPDGCKDFLRSLTRTHEQAFSKATPWWRTDPAIPLEARCTPCGLRFLLHSRRRPPLRRSFTRPLSTTSRSTTSTQRRC